MVPARVAGVDCPRYRPAVSPLRALVAVSLALCGGAALAVCGTTDETCDVVDCSGHGTCLALGDGVICACAPGYHPAALACVRDGETAEDAGAEADAAAEAGP